MIGRGQTWLDASTYSVEKDITALCDVTAGGFWVVHVVPSNFWETEQVKKKAKDGLFLVTEGQKKRGKDKKKIE